MGLQMVFFKSQEYFAKLEYNLFYCLRIQRTEILKMIDFAILTALSMRYFYLLIYNVSHTNISALLMGKIP